MSSNPYEFDLLRTIFIKRMMTNLKLKKVSCKLEGVDGVS